MILFSKQWGFVYWPGNSRTGEMEISSILPWWERNWGISFSSPITDFLITPEKFKSMKSLHLLHNCQFSVNLITYFTLLLISIIPDFNEPVRFQKHMENIKGNRFLLCQLKILISLPCTKLDTVLFSFTLFCFSSLWNNTKNTRRLIVFPNALFFF